MKYQYSHKDVHMRSKFIHRLNFCTYDTYTQDLPFELQCRPDRVFGEDNVGMGLSVVASFEFKTDLIPGLTTAMSVRIVRRTVHVKWHTKCIQRGKRREN